MHSGSLVTLCSDYHLSFWPFYFLTHWRLVNYLLCHCFPYMPDVGLNLSHFHSTWRDWHSTPFSEGKLIHRKLKQIMHAYLIIEEMAGL